MHRRISPGIVIGSRMEIYGLTDSLPDVSIAALAPSDKEKTTRSMAQRNISVFKQFTGEQSGHVRLKPKDETETDKERNPLLCRACGNEVTDSERSTVVNGRHEHSFVNPAGIAYRIGCFADVWGCVFHGIPTREFTWFTGFTWCFCSCASCFTQLGWYYQSGQGEFFGLILDNLTRKVKAH